MPEVKLEARTSYDAGNGVTSDFVAARDLSISVDTENCVRSTHTVTTSSQLVRIDSVGEQPFVMFINRDDTATITIASFIQLKPGEVCCFRPYGNIFASTDAGTAVLEFLACGTGEGY